jgi:hypothetical protein
MSQRPREEGQRRRQPIERECGQYSIHKKGNSLTVIVPGRISIAADSVIIREAFYLDRVIYLRIIPVTEAVGDDFTKQCVKVFDGERIIERKIDYYSVRVDADGQWVTIPSKRSTDRFARKTTPMVVSAHTDTGVAYLKLFPECLYEHADSSDTTDIIAVEQTTTGPPTDLSRAVP